MKPSTESTNVSVSTFVVVLVTVNLKQIVKCTNWQTFLKRRSEFKATETISSKTIFRLTRKINQNRYNLSKTDKHAARTQASTLSPCTSKHSHSPSFSTIRWSLKITLNWSQGQVPVDYLRSSTLFTWRSTSKLMEPISAKVLKFLHYIGLTTGLTILNYSKLCNLKGKITIHFTQVGI